MNYVASGFLHVAWWSWLIVLLPLAAAALIGLMGPVLRGRSHWPAILGVAGSLAVSIALFLAIPASVPDATRHEAAPGHGAPETANVVISRPTMVKSNVPDAGLVADVSYFDWIQTGSTQAASVIAAKFLIDPLTIVMLLTVTGVSLLVVIYSCGYMRDHHGHPERGYERFFAFLALFVASMCILVLAGNFVVLYMGWELVGLCSYLLIG
jgi:NADH-quinone oxidoreductase subunit L